MKMEWTKQRVFECKVQDAWGMCPKRVIMRHRDDGVIYVLTITIGHPVFDAREYIVKEFAKFALQQTGVHPCGEKDFDKTFLMNLLNYNGTEITTGLFYSFPDIDPKRVHEWMGKEFRRPIPQQFESKDDEFLPHNLKRGLP